MVLFLDSLDQISPADGAHSLMWLPTKLPPHVKFVVSSLPKLYGVLDTLFRIIPNKENRIEITPLGMFTSMFALVRVEQIMLEFAFLIINN